ncbi:DNA gyrase subunit A [Staphylococcus aureus]|uniref:DNA gyrase subunit A n=1 Tax=Staphylococcus aureus TaxID=1280 RepID=A0A380DNB5_STAAU|nr:DNA gyrase subunit A [Staphylococcus aureus]
MIALVNGRPKLINLKEALVHYLEHQKTVVRRRTQYNLRKAKDRAHILEGLRIALDHIDEIIQRFVSQIQIKLQWKACNNASNFLKNKLKLF